MINSIKNGKIDVSFIEVEILFSKLQHRCPLMSHESDDTKTPSFEVIVKKHKELRVVPKWNIKLKVTHNPHNILMG